MKRLKFAFISTTRQITNPIIDASVRYRCFNVAEALQASGYLVTVLPWVAGESELYNFDVYIFHRPNINQIKYISNLQKLNKCLIADYDDMIFGNAEHALTAPMALNDRDKEQEVIEYFRNNTLVLQYFDFITCSTKPLADHAKNFTTAKIVQLHNTIADSVLSFINNNFTNKKIYDFGYFAGTSSHQKDFEVIQKPLTKFLFENPYVNFLLIGDIKLDARLETLPNIHRSNLTYYLRLFDRIASCRYSISPLVNNFFNECKSNIKLLESSVAGTQLISTRIPDMQKAHEYKLSFADTENDWYEMFYYAITGSDNYEDLCLENRHTTEYKFNSKISANILINILEGKI